MSRREMTPLYRREMAVNSNTFDASGWEEWLPDPKKLDIIPPSIAAALIFAQPVAAEVQVWDCPDWFEGAWVDNKNPAYPGGVINVQLGPEDLRYLPLPLYGAAETVLHCGWDPGGKLGNGIKEQRLSEEPRAGEIFTALVNDAYAPEDSALEIVFNPDGNRVIVRKINPPEGAPNVVLLPLPAPAPGDAGYQKQNADRAPRSELSPTGIALLCGVPLAGLALFFRQPIQYILSDWAMDRNMRRDKKEKRQDRKRSEQLKQLQDHLQRETELDERLRRVQNSIPRQNKTPIIIGRETIPHTDSHVNDQMQKLYDRRLAERGREIREENTEKLLERIFARRSPLKPEE